MTDLRAGTWHQGQIVWHEGATTDLDRSTAFYEELLGWRHHDSDMGPMGIYRHFTVGDTDIAGMYKLGEQMAGVPPHWIQYISVGDVDAAAATAKANGATIRMGPLDIPNVGRAAYISDPQGAMVALFKDLKGDPPPPAPPYPPGAFCWESLATTDKAAALAFYAKVIGYKAGDWQGSTTFQTSDDPRSAVADVNIAPPGVPPNWMSHVVVADLAMSRDRVKRLGGNVLMAEIDIPETGKMCVIADPVGAVISIFEAAARA